MTDRARPGLSGALTFRGRRMPRVTRCMRRTTRGRRCGGERVRAMAPGRASEEARRLLEHVRVEDVPEAVAPSDQAFHERDADALAKGEIQNAPEHQPD